MEDEEKWYAFIYPKNHERFEKPKIINADMASNARYMLDEKGEWYFKTPYGLQLTREYRSLTKEVACQLNSRVLDFYLKHIAPMLLGGKYRYQSRYIGELPCKVEDENELSGMNEFLNPILNMLDLDNKTDRFPEAYLGAYDGELEYITYEWQTRRYPVDAEVQGDVEGEFTVQAGRSDTISDPAMYADDREARKQRAEYVRAAVDGRNVKSGAETTIPIPRSDDGVAALLATLADDRETVDETSIEELEAEIDEAVYDLFELTPEEREVVEEYLEVF